MKKTPKLLLLGTGGQVGWELQRSLASFPGLISLNRDRLDLQNLDSIRHEVQSIRPAVIFNAAAYTGVDAAETDRDLAYRINAEAPRVLAEEAARLGCLLVHYSTDYVFDGTKGAPYREEDSPNPLNVYGRTKWEGEKAIEDSGVFHLIFRTSWVYGGRGRNFFLTLQRLAREKDRLAIVNDQTGAPTWCRSIARTTVQAVQMVLGPNLDQPCEHPEDHSGLYHLSCGGETTWFGFAQRIVELMALDLPPQIEPTSTEAFGALAPRPRYSVLSNEKLNAHFRVRLPSWEEALRMVAAEQHSA